MVGVFRRSLSFPNKNPNRPSKPPISYHTRSISLPCRSHPLISQINDDINDLKSLISNNPSTASICQSLNQLKNIQDSLHDILLLPQTQESLYSRRKWVEKLLEDFLRFIDLYGTFQSSLLLLKEEHREAHVALRKRDECKISLYIKIREKMASELGKLAITIRTSVVPPSTVSIGDTEVVSVIVNVTELTVSVSVMLFNGISASFMSRKWMGLRLPKRIKKVRVEEGIIEFQQVGVESLVALKKKGAEEVMLISKKMGDLESCICSIESGSERVFRSLINTRVSLLNSLTQC